MINFTVYGKPIPQGRARFSTQGGFARAYDPATSRSAKAEIAWTAKQLCEKPLDGPLVLTLKVYRDVPKSFSKKHRLKALEGDIRPITRPDGDNHLKLCLDACNGILWYDDAQIVDMQVQKFYSDEPRTEVWVSKLMP